MHFKILGLASDTESINVKNNGEKKRRNAHKGKEEGWQIDEADENGRWV